jgi:hypothetical protein
VRPPTVFGFGKANSTGGYTRGWGVACAPRLVGKVGAREGEQDPRADSRRAHGERNNELIRARLVQWLHWHN